MKVTPLKDGTLLVTLEEGGGWKRKIAEELGVDEDSFYLTKGVGGKLVQEGEQCPGMVVLVPRLKGGKGGFGSMLRAIGAQIEKTTNRDACRDLSGRRLRDINEEQKLKRWFAKQKEREEEKQEAKKRKLERLKQLTEGPPLPVIDDPEYHKARAGMADAVYEAVDQGFEASKDKEVSSSTSSDEASRDEISCNESGKSEPQSEKPGPSTSTVSSVPKPPEKTKVFKKTMLDEDLESCSSSDESDEEIASKKARIDNN